MLLLEAELRAACPVLAGFAAPMQILYVYLPHSSRNVAVAMLVQAKARAGSGGGRREPDLGAKNSSAAGISPGL